MKIHHHLLTSLIASVSISLYASSGTDQKIEDGAKASYNYRTLLEDKVNVSVNDGVVTLTGVVGDKELRSVAEDTVSNLPGVLSVDNKITLDPALKEHSDSWIALKLHTQLLVSTDVSNSDTTINVNDGVVTLTGTADSLAQKELTGEYAKEIDWVKSVKNDIVVEKPSAKAAAKRASIDDASITSQIKYALSSHKAALGSKAKIVTTDGTVVISGEASSSAEKSLITKLALSIRGVKSMTNDLVVKD